MVVCGFMSTRLTMTPFSATNAAVNGMLVFFIQKHCWANSSNTNNMPSEVGMLPRNISPVERCSGDVANCTSIKFMPAVILVRGRSNWAFCAELILSVAPKKQSIKAKMFFMTGFSQNS